MPNPFLGVRISPELNEAIAARMRETGQSKSDIVIAALRSYLGMPSSQERLDEIEQRLSALEEIAGDIWKKQETVAEPEYHHTRDITHRDINHQ